MELTDAELEAVHTVLFDQYYYGEEYVYHDDDEGRAVGTALGKVIDEAKRRGFWWAR